MITSEIFKNPQILIAGRHDKMIQNILDYEYLCGLKTTSLMGIINPFGTSNRSSYFFGSQNIFLQQFRNLKQAKEFSNAKILINALSERSAAATSLEALGLDFNFIYIMAEGIPERQSLEMSFLAREKKSLILGPASVGMLLPGRLRLGLIGGPTDNLAANNLFQPGGINLITRSGGLFNELCASIYRSEIGLYSGAAIGGDRFIGSTFLDYIKLWDGDKNVKLHLLLGEVGGDLEYEVAEALKAGQITKPVLVHFIGASAEVLPTFLQFGHAGAKANNDRETVKAKIQFFKECGAIVATSYGQIDEMLVSQKKKNKWPTQLKKDIPLLPISQQEALKKNLIRHKPSFVCTISDDRGEEGTYGKKPISYYAEPRNNQSIVDVLTQLWFKREYPKWASEYLDLVIKILADHGAATSGSHNARVAARAGKGVVESLTSGLLTIGPRFGGAGDEATREFLEAYLKNEAPLEFVNRHKNSGKYISGIGHRVKSIHNPDSRVVILDDYSQINFPGPRNIFEYAKSVEEVTTAKKDNLILNVDGAYGALLCDMWLILGYTNVEINKMLKDGVLTAIFVFGRSVGTIGHILDEKRQDSPLYRHDLNDIWYDLE